MRLLRDIRIIIAPVKNVNYVWMASMGSVMKALGRRGRRRYRRGKSKVKKIEKKVAVLSKAVKAEQRFVSTANANGTAIITAGTFVLMNGMTTGAADGAREGTSIVINRISLKGVAYVRPTATTNGATTIRLMVVLDRMVPQTAGSGAIFTPAELLDNAGDNNNNVHSLMRFTNRNRFRVLYDRTRCIAPKPNTRQAVAVGTQEDGDWCFSISKRFKRGIVVKYNTGTAGTIADLAQNSLYFIAFADNSSYGNIWSRHHVYYTP